MEQARLFFFPEICGFNPQEMNVPGYPAVLSFIKSEGGKNKSILIKIILAYLGLQFTRESQYSSHLYYDNCHSPTQPQHELELDLIMGRKPPPTTPHRNF